MGIYLGLLVLCFCFIFLLIQKIFNYYLDEFDIDKTLPLTTGKTNFQYLLVGIKYLSINNY